MRLVKRIKVPRTVQGPKHGKVVSARLTLEDRTVLDVLAKQHVVGVCTLARLILENYIEQHHSKERRAAKRKQR